jgi:putative transposase
MGDAIPHRVKRHVHPDVKPHAPAPVQATGIDYLRLIEAAHQANIGQAINFAALADGEATRDARADTGEDGENGEQDR